MSLCIDICVGSVLLDELATWTHILAHEHGEGVVSLCCIIDGHLLEEARFRVHGGLPKLFWVHLTKTFVSLHLNLVL